MSLIGPDSLGGKLLARLRGLKPTAPPLQDAEEDVEALTPEQAADLCAAFQTDNLQAVKDVLNCLVLSECIYKAFDLGPEAAVAAVGQLKQQLSPQLVDLQELQCSLPHVPHRYLLARAGGTLYVAFMGTKQARDLVADANMLQEALWRDAEHAGQRLAVPAVHRGFLARARTIPAESLYQWAQSQGCRLVFCGHSLGGAVAVLCTLRLLRQLTPAQAPPALHCCCFGTPAIGNWRLARHVDAEGWAQHFSSYLLPEDVVPQVFAVPTVGTRAAAASRTGSTGLVQVDDPSAPGSGSDEEQPLQRAASSPAVLGDSSTSSSASPPLNPRGHADDEADTDVEVDVNDEAEAASSSATSSPSKLLAGYGLRGLWSNGWALPQLPQRLQAAARYGLRGAARLMPRYAHFGRPRYLHPTRMDATVRAAMAANARGSTEAERRTLLLAMHRMSAYRARALSLATSIVPHLWLNSTGDASPEVVLSDRLAPPLRPAAAHVVLPPLRPHALQPQLLDGRGSSVTAAGTGWLWPQVRGGGRAAKGVVAVRIQVAGEGLGSCSSAQLIINGTTTVPAVVQHQPSVIQYVPASTAQPTEQPQGLRQRVPAVLQRWRQHLWPLPSHDALPSEEAQIVAQLPPWLAQTLAASDDAAVLLQLRSDFWTASLPVQLARHSVWLAGGPPDAVAAVFECLTEAGQAAFGTGAVGAPSVLPGLQQWLSWLPVPVGDRASPWSQHPEDAPAPQDGDDVGASKGSAVPDAARPLPLLRSWVESATHLVSLRQFRPAEQQQQHTLLHANSSLSTSSELQQDQNAASMLATAPLPSRSAFRVRYTNATALLGTSGGLRRHLRPITSLLRFRAITAANTTPSRRLSPTLTTEPAEAVPQAAPQQQQTQGFADDAGKVVRWALRMAELGQTLSWAGMPARWSPVKHAPLPSCIIVLAPAEGPNNADDQKAVRDLAQAAAALGVGTVVALLGDISEPSFAAQRRAPRWAAACGLPGGQRSVAVLDLGQAAELDLADASFSSEQMQREVAGVETLREVVHREVGKIGLGLPAPMSKL